MFSAKNYVTVQTLEEAWELNQKRRNKILGGMLWLKMENISLDTVIDLSALGLDKIEETDTEFTIGAMTTLRALETHEGLNKYTNGAVYEAMRHIVGVQFRNCATVGGSIFGRYGFSDVLTLLTVTDAYVELYKGGIIPLCEFAKMKPDNDILVRIIIKKQPRARFIYSSVRNTKTDFPVLAFASALIGDKLLASVGARPGRAVLLSADKSDFVRAEEYGEFIQKNTVFGSNLRAGAEYRKHLAGVLAKRAFSAFSKEV